MLLCFSKLPFLFSLLFSHNIPDKTLKIIRKFSLYRNVYTSCYNVCCKRVKRPQIRSLNGQLHSSSNNKIPNNKKFQLSTICNQNNHQYFKTMNKTNNIALIFESLTSKIMCTGNLIHPKFILTTGICVLK